MDKRTGFIETGVLAGIAVLIGMVGSFAYFTNSGPGVGTETTSGNFPTVLNNFQDGDVINSGDWNNIEEAIGTTNSTSTGSINYLIRNAASKLGSISNITATTGTLLYANNGIWNGLSIGSPGQVLEVSGGLPSWGTDDTGGGGGTTTTIASQGTATGPAFTFATSGPMLSISGSGGTVTFTMSSSSLNLGSLANPASSSIVALIHSTATISAQGGTATQNFTFATSGPMLSISASGNTVTFTMSSSSLNLGSLPYLTTSTGLTKTNFATSSVSQWTNDAYARWNQSCGSTNKVSSISATGTIVCSTDETGAGVSSTSVYQGYGITVSPNPLTTSGTVAINTTTLNGLYVATGTLWSQVISSSSLGATAYGWGNHAVAGYSTSSDPSVTVCASGCDFTTDGTADDVQINAALAAIPNGGTVFIKAGTYDIASSITVTSSQRISGDGRGTILLAANSFNKDLIRTGTSSDSTRRGITIENLKIDGNRGGNSVGRCIYGFNIRNSIIRNNWFTNCEEEAIYFDGGPSEIGYLNLIEGNEIDQSDAGIHTRYSEHNIIAHNYFSWIDGIAFYGESDMDVIDANLFDAITGMGVYLNYGAGQWRVTNNSFERMDSDVIVVRAAKDTTVSHNYIEVTSNLSGVVNGQYGGDGADHLVVTNNTFHSRDHSATNTWGIEEQGSSTGSIYANNLAEEMSVPVLMNAASVNYTVYNNAENARFTSYDSGNSFTFYTGDAERLRISSSGLIMVMNNNLVDANGTKYVTSSVGGASTTISAQGGTATGPFTFATSGPMLGITASGNTVTFTMSSSSLNLGQFLTTSTGLTTANFSSANISQWTNNSGYIQSSSVPTLAHATATITAQGGTASQQFTFATSGPLMGITASGNTVTFTSVSTSTILSGYTPSTGIPGLVHATATITAQGGTASQQFTFATSGPMLSITASGNTVTFTMSSSSLNLASLPYLSTSTGLTKSNFATTSVSQWVNDAYTPWNQTCTGSTKVYGISATGTLVCTTDLTGVGGGATTTITAQGVTANGPDFTFATSGQGISITASGATLTFAYSSSSLNLGSFLTTSTGLTTANFATTSVGQWANNGLYLTTSTGLTTANFSSANISQWTNNSNYIQSSSVPTLAHATATITAQGVAATQQFIFATSGPLLGITASGNTVTFTTLATSSILAGYPKNTEVPGLVHATATITAQGGTATQNFTFATSGPMLSIAATGNTVTFTMSTSSLNLGTMSTQSASGYAFSNQTCSGTDKVSSISTTGTIVCTTDQSGGGGSVTINNITTSTYSFAQGTNITITSSTGANGIGILTIAATGGTAAAAGSSTAIQYNGDGTNLGAFNGFNFLSSTLTMNLSSTAGLISLSGSSTSNYKFIIYGSAQTDAQRLLWVTSSTGATYVSSSLYVAGRRIDGDECYNFIIERPTSTEDLYWMTHNHTSTITQFTSVHKTNGDSATFNIWWAPSRNATSGTTQKLWATNATSSATTTPDFYPTRQAFGSTTIPANSVMRIITSAASSTEWGISLCFYDDY